MNKKEIVHRLQEEIRVAESIMASDRTTLLAKEFYAGRETAAQLAIDLLDYLDVDTE